MPKELPKLVKNKNLYLNQLNETLVTNLQNGGNYFYPTPLLMKSIV